MGRTFELLGLAAFNIFIAMTLSAMFLTNSAQDRYDSLSEPTIERFITKVTRISTGAHPDLDAYAITSFFMDHIAEDGRFVTTLKYEIPGLNSNEEHIEMGKMDFISNILEGRKTVSKHQSNVDIEYIDVSDTGKTADVVTTSYERGMMAVPDASGQRRMMPVMGISYCEQTVMLSANKQIQMAGAQCSTNIKVKNSL